MTHPAPEARRTSQALVALLLVTLSLYAIPLDWGLPSWYGWAHDEVTPREVRDAARMGFGDGWANKYPPLHFQVLAALFAPGEWLADRGILAGGSYERHQRNFLLGRALSVLLATASVYVVYRIARELLSRRASLLAAAIAAGSAPLGYYAKTMNMEAPYNFWFLVSMLFYVRVRKRQRLRDYLAMSAATAFAIGSKDQAYAYYLVVPVLLLHGLNQARRGEPGAAPGWLALLRDRRIVLGGGMALGAFLLIHQLPFEIESFRNHFGHMRRVSGSIAEYSATPAGHLGLALGSLRNIAFCMGTPLFLAALAGILLALRRAPRSDPRRGILLSLLIPLAGYYVTFVAVIRYSYDRFFLGTGAILALFAALALDRLLERLPGPRWAGPALVGTLLGHAALRVVAVDVRMLLDSRYDAEAWLDRAAPPGARILGLGSPTVLPRVPASLPWYRLQAGIARHLRASAAHILVTSNLELVHPYARRVHERLLASELNYAPAVSFECRTPLDWLLDFRGVRSNLETIGPRIEVYRQQRPWSRPVDRLIADTMDALRRPEPGPLHAIQAELASSGVPELLPLAGELISAIGVADDGWTLGDRPALVLVRNPSTRPWRPRLRLSVDAPPGALPITAYLESAAGQARHTFGVAETREIELEELAAHGVRLYLAYVDRSWLPAAEDRDDRRLGVRVRAPEASLELLEPGIRASGATADGWLVDGEPALLTLENRTAHPATPVLRLLMSAPREALPIEVRLEGVDERHELRFEEPSARAVALRPLAPYASRALLVWTDQTWRPGGGDPRALGAQLQGAEWRLYPQASPVPP